jgi:hypothetical protein
MRTLVYLLAFLFASCGVSRQPGWAQWERAQQISHMPKWQSTRTHLGNAHPTGWPVYQRKVINHIAFRVGPKNVHKKNGNNK